MSTFRPPSVPLVTVDPYFSIWSPADCLYDQPTRHWSGKGSSLNGLLSIDGIWHRFMGRSPMDLEAALLRQTDCKVLPMETIYTFEGEGVRLTLNFMTPLLPDDLDLMSRPVSYISYQLESLDGKEHDVKIYFDACADVTMDQSGKTIAIRYGEDYISMGRGDQGVLSKSGDGVNIDWGNLYLSAPDHTMVSVNQANKPALLKNLPYKSLQDSYTQDESSPTSPYLCCMKEYKVLKTVSSYFCLGYEDFYSIEYFGEKIKAYCYRDGKTFPELLKEAYQGYASVCERVSAFQKDLLQKAAPYGEKYCDLISLAFRQAIAAHKLTWHEGEIQFLSKECFSNGCIGTVDVTYPSIPLFLLYNPELVCGMLNPIFRYADMEQWPFPYAPHDVGQYPLANGQVYGYNRKGRFMDHHYQMPVEECGNMLLCVAAVCRAKGDLSYAEAHRKILTQWADCLVDFGWDPENQLCTDDFAGHLAHNCNLSIKGILGIAAWGDLLVKMGDTEAGEKYIQVAKKYAKEMETAAWDGDHYRLAFDRPASWSIKYNLVWDRLLHLGIFDPKVAETEVAYYKTKINAYGLPLDSRSDYTKSDWQMWSVCLTDDAEYRNAIIEAMWEMLCVTPDRVPFTDWYYTSVPNQRGFQNRTVQGGLFFPLLQW